MKNLFFVFVLMLSALSCFAQRKNEVSITHYIFPDFVNAKVIFKTGVPVDSKMNYNSILQEMIYSDKGKLMAMANLQLVDTVLLEGRKFIPVDKVFYEVLIDGDIALCAQYTCSIIPPGQPAAYGGTSQTSAVTNYSSLNSGGQLYQLTLPTDYKLSPMCIYWIKKDGDYYRAYNLNQFTKVFSAKADEIKAWAKKNKPDFKNQDDVLKLFGFCMNGQ